MIAFDASTAREKDQNGYLRVSQSRITKEQVADYYGREIPFYSDLGLDPDKVYKVYRPADELIKAIDSFNGLPVLIRHEADSAFEPQKHLRVGALGTDAKFDGTYITNSITFHDATAISLIEDGSQKELSAGYFYDPVIEEGEFEGVKYEVRMKNIRGNHVAIVAVGRAGKDCMVADEQNIGGFMSDKKKSLKDKITAWLTSDQTLDLLSNDMYGEQSQSMGADDGKGAIISKLRELGTQHNLEGSVIEDLIRMVDALNSTSIEDSDPDTKKAEDEDKKDEKKNVTGDSMTPNLPNYDISLIKKQLFEEMQAQFASKAEAAESAKSIIGSVNPMSFDSADSIYLFALKSIGRDISAIPAGAAKFVLEEYKNSHITKVDSFMSMDQKSTTKTFIDDMDLTHIQRKS